MVLLHLIKEFIHIGCLSFGGGLVVIPFIQKMASTTGWITESQIIEMIAISEITPGPIAVNMATYVGYIVKGVYGAVLSTLALILPQMLIVFFIYKIFHRFKENGNVLITLRGIRPVALALTTGGALVIFKSAFLKLENDTAINVDLINILNWKAISLGVVLIIAMRKIKWHPIIYFLISGAIAIVFGLT